MDFTTLQQHEILTYLEAHFGELGAGDVDPDDAAMWAIGLKDEVLNLDVVPSGFALTQVTMPDMSLGWGGIKVRYSKLVAVYVTPEAKGKGVGTSLVESVMAKYMSNYPMRLECVGEVRQSFFAEFGFAVIDSNADFYVMECKPESAKQRRKQVMMNKSIVMSYAKYVALEEGILDSDVDAKLKAGDIAEAIRIMQIRQDSLRAVKRTVIGEKKTEVQSMIDSIDEAIDAIQQP
jgi:GNAT superfamily N-acetyltransferase